MGVDDFTSFLVTNLLRSTIDQLSHAQLKHWAKWASGVDATLDRAESIVPKYRELLRPANLAAFGVLLSGGAEESRFNAFLESLSRE
jgi:hypothetical protein